MKNKNDNDKPILKSSKKSVIIILVFALIAFVTIVVISNTIQDFEKLEPIILILFVVFFIVALFLKGGTTSNDFNKIVNMFREELLTKYGSNSIINTVDNIEYPDGDESKENHIRKQFNMQIQIPKFNCTVNSYDLQRLTRNIYNESDSLMPIYKYVRIDSVMEYRYKIIDKQINDVTISKNKDELVYVKNNELIIEKTVYPKTYSRNNLKEDVNDIQNFYENICVPLINDKIDIEPSKEKNNEDINKIISKMKFSLNLNTPSIILIMLGLACIGFSIFTIINKQYHYLITSLVSSFIMFFMALICSKVHVKLGNYVVFLGVIIALLLTNIIKIFPFYVDLERNYSVQVIENVFYEHKFNIAEDMEYKISHDIIYLDSKHNYIYRVKSNKKINSGKIIMNNGRLKYQLETNNECITKNYDDEKFSIISGICDFN